MAGEDSEPEKMSSELAGTHFMIGKKNPMKIPEFKRSGIGLIAEFRGIPNGFPNLGGLVHQKGGRSLPLREKGVPAKCTIPKCPDWVFLPSSEVAPCPLSPWKCANSSFCYVFLYFQYIFCIQGVISYFYCFFQLTSSAFRKKCPLAHIFERFLMSHSKCPILIVL